MTPNWEKNPSHFNLLEEIDRLNYETNSFVRSKGCLSLRSCGNKAALCIVIAFGNHFKMSLHLAPVI